MGMTVKTVRHLYDAHDKYEERQHKQALATHRVAAHADKDEYARFLADVFGERV